MRCETAEYVGYRMSQAREALDVARLSFDNGHLNSTVNRLYYSCFYAVSALLLCEGHQSSKHTGIRSLFDRHWVKPGRFPVEMARFYRALFSRRQQGDCEDLVYFEHEEVQTWLAEADAFITRISEEVEKLFP